MLALKVCGELGVYYKVMGCFIGMSPFCASVQVLWISNPPTFINYDDRVVVEKLSNGRIDTASPLIILVSAVLAVFLARS